MLEQLAGEGYARVVGAIDRLLAAGRAQGVVRADLDAEELLLVVGFLWRLDLTGDRDERSARMLDVVMAGLAAPAAA